MTAPQRFMPRKSARHFFILVSALLATFALLATGLAPAAGAAPTALCKVNENPCEPESTYVGGMTVQGVAKDFKIESNAITYTCEEAAIELTTSESTGEPLKSKLKNLTFKNCKGGANSCTVEKPSSNTYSSPGISANGQDSGTIYPFGASWTWLCTAGGWDSGFKVTFDSRNVEATIGAGTIGGTGKAIKCSGAGCSGEPKLTAHFKFAWPDSVYVEEGIWGGWAVPDGETTLCAAAEEAEAEEFCEEENFFAPETAIEASAGKPVKLVTSYYTVECKDSTLKAQTEGLQGGAPFGVQVSSPAFSNCSSSIEELNPCTVQSVSGKVPGGLSWIGGNNGILTWEKGLKFILTCAPISCTFSIEGNIYSGVVESTVTGGKPAHISIPSASLGEEKGLLCIKDGSSYLEAPDYAVNSPGAFYVSRY